MEKKMLRRALVDVDDTIADTQKMLIHKVSEDTGHKFVFEEMDRDYREGDGEHTKIWREAVWNILKQPDVMVTVAPSKGALDAIIKLNNGGVQPDIVTARKEILAEATGEWLESHGFAHHIHQRPIREDGESGVEFKLRVARENAYDVAFDDTYDIAIALAGVIPVVYMINKPWNLDHDTPDNIERVDSFAEGVDLYLNAT
jgi:uncharacterized HAD superfamily protein